MWIMICGPSGSSKNLIAEMLTKDGFEDLSFPVSTDPDPFMRELKTSQGRLKSQLKAAELMTRRDVFTVRSFWDSCEVMIPTMEKFQEITSFESAIFQEIYGTFRDNDFLTPPHAVVYMKMPPMSAYNRMLLRNVDVNQEQFNYQVELYEKFIERVKAPVLEIDGSETPDKIKRNLEFSIASIKATQAGGGIWKKGFFR